MEKDRIEHEALRLTEGERKLVGPKPVTAIKLVQKRLTIHGVEAKMVVDRARVLLGVESTPP